MSEVPTVPKRIVVIDGQGYLLHPLTTPEEANTVARVLARATRVSRLREPVVVVRGGEWPTPIVTVAQADHVRVVRRPAWWPRWRSSAERRW